MLLYGETGLNRVLNREFSIGACFCPKNAIGCVLIEGCRGTGDNCSVDVTSLLY